MTYFRALKCDIGLCVLLLVTVHRPGTQLPQQLCSAGGHQRGRIRNRARYDAQVTRAADICLHRDWKRLNRKPHSAAL